MLAGPWLGLGYLFRLGHGNVSFGPGELSPSDVLPKLFSGELDGGRRLSAFRGRLTQRRSQARGSDYAPSGSFEPMGSGRRTCWKEKYVRVVPHRFQNVDTTAFR